MCGINGFNFRDSDLIEKMNKEINYRGPDGDGIFIDENLSLGHRRLSIIDLSPKASQPMNSFDNRHVIVFNGEIYNFKELKKELENDYPFKSNSDTEVILAAYKKWGHDCASKFNGIFAFAIWDKDHKELFLVRDHLGIKPLFYYFDGSKFIFSSEIKAILKHNIDRKLNISALNYYFRFLYINGPETIWQNIYKVPPASYLLFKNNQVKIEKYWQITDFQDYNNRNEIKEILKKTMSRAVKRQLIADVPVGLFLSGGIDSTIILGLMSESTSGPIKTFSLGFDIDIKDDKFSSDYLLARETASHYKTDHHELIIGPQDIAGNLEKVIWQMDDLVANPTQFSIFLLSELVKKNGIKVVLGGDGGDELFGGYDRYYYYNLIEKLHRLPKILRDNSINQVIFSLLGKNKIYEKLNLTEQIDIFWSFRAQKEKIVSRFLKPEISDLRSVRDYVNKNNFQSISQSLDLAKMMMKVDVDTWLVDQSLAQSDKMSMVWGVEQRIPILDKEMVELANKIPTKYKINNSKQGKLIFKEALREYIPDSIYNKQKTGWFAPTAKWLRTGMKDMAYEILSESYNPEVKDFFDFSAIKEILDNHIYGREYALNTIWSLINFQVWYKQYSK